jgi:hypothetical protein
MMDELVEYARSVERRWVGGAVGRAKLDQTAKVKRGGKPVAVTMTAAGLRAQLRVQQHRCAMTGLRFYDDDAVPSKNGSRPTSPSVDRIDCDGDYSDGNIRIILNGLHGLRGRGSDTTMYRIARALIAREPVLPGAAAT